VVPVSVGPAPPAWPRWLPFAGLGALAVLAVGVVVWLASSGSSPTDDKPEGQKPQAANTRPSPTPSRTADPPAPRGQPVSRPLLPPARDEPIDPDAPLLFVQVRSWDKLLEGVRLLAGAAGQERAINQFTDALKRGFGQDGLPGIDGKKPWGAYAQVSADLTSWSAVGLVPVSDQAQFRRLLPALGFLEQQTEGDVAILRCQHPQIQLPQPVALRFAHGYACLTLAAHRRALADGRLVPPAKLFVDRGGKNIFANLRLDRIPRAVRDEVRGKLGEIKRQVPRVDGRAIQEYADKLADVLTESVNALLDGGQDLSFGLEVDPATRAVEVALSLRGKERSPLAVNIAALGETPSLFGELVSEDAAFGALVNLRLPQALRGRLPAVVDEVTRLTLRDTIEPKDRKEAERLFRALGPTFAAGELDGCVVLRARGKGQPGTFVGGLKVAQGEQLDQLFQDLVATLADRGDRALFELRAERLAGVAVHRHNWQRTFVGPDLRRVVGDNPNYYAFRSNALFWAGGAGGREALEQALLDRPRPGPLALLALNLKALNELTPLEEGDQARAARVLDDRNPGRVRLALEADSALRLRARIDLAVVRFVTDKAGLFQFRLEMKPR
jgi:hypothetical protein